MPPLETAERPDVARPTPPPRDLEVALIEPRSPGILARLGEAWRYRRLFMFFGQQSLSAVFNQTFIGWIRFIMRSGVPIVITAFFFGAIARFPSGDTPYLLFVLVGSTVWFLFEFTVLTATRAMRQHARLVTRVYFPRLILVPANTMEAIVRAVVMIGLILIAAGYYLLTEGRWYLTGGSGLLVAAGALAYSWLLGIAFGLWTSVLEAPASDVRYSARYTMRFCFYLTPIVYPLSYVPEQWRWAFLLNPMTGIVEAFRWALLGHGDVSPVSLVSSLVVLLVVFLAGLDFFGRAEAKMVDAL